MDHMSLYSSYHAKTMVKPNKKKVKGYSPKFHMSFLIKTTSNCSENDHAHFYFLHNLSLG
ncbi:unnamed protein product [Brassica rapa]|uniref:Uncharacterized protein n=1 Tax=Brassica campestris TaxID=3711 RepID=A0A3P6AHT1_BRACM|nr:unnamed protein product [Brassica rapa]VDC89195.1 unnamed protein product [Brassica rapa]